MKLLNREYLKIHEGIFYVLFIYFITLHVEARDEEAQIDGGRGKLSGYAVLCIGENDEERSIHSELGGREIINECLDEMSLQSTERQEGSICSRFCDSKRVFLEKVGLLAGVVGIVGYGSYYLYHLSQMKSKYCKSNFPDTNSNCMDLACLSQNNMTAASYYDCYLNRYCWDDSNNPYKFCLNSQCEDYESQCYHYTNLGNEIGVFSFIIICCCCFVCSRG